MRVSRAEGEALREGGSRVTVVCRVAWGGRSTGGGGGSRENWDVVQTWSRGDIGKEWLGGTGDGSWAADRGRQGEGGEKERESAAGQAKGSGEGERHWGPIRGDVEGRGQVGAVGGGGPGEMS